MTDDGDHDLGQKLRDAGIPYYVCPHCSIINVNPNDVRERYCGRCRRFVDDPSTIEPPTGE